MDRQNDECSPLHSSEAEHLPGFPDAVDVETTNQTLHSFTKCMRPSGQPEAVFSGVAQIAPIDSQTPIYIPTNENPADFFKSSSQLLFPVSIQQSHLNFPPSLPTLASTELSPVAENLWPDERPSGTLGIAAEITAVTTTVAFVSQLAILGDERSDLRTPLRTQFPAPPSPSPGVMETCDCLGPSGISVPSSSTTQQNVPLSVDIHLCAATPIDSLQADDSPDEDGTRHLYQDSMPSVSFRSPANSCHVTTVLVPKTLVTLPASETDSAARAMDPDPTLSTMPFSSSTSLPLDVRLPHDRPRDCLLALDLPSDITLVPYRPAAHGPETPLADPVAQDETPPSGRLPPSSLPASQISEFSLSTNHADVASAPDTGHSGSCEDTAMLDHSPTRVEENAMDAQTPDATDMLALGFYAGTSEGSRLPLGTSVDEDMVFELPASSPPSSSPPGLFSSPAGSLYGSPPSSSPLGPPCDAEDQLPTPRTQDADTPGQSLPLKRAREAEESSEIAGISNLECRPPKRMKTRVESSETSVPNPTRPTQTSQARQHKKLVAPFRSPVIKGPLVHGGLPAVYASGRAAAPAYASKPPAEDNTNEADAAVAPNIHVATKDRTARAAKQFKPPVQVAYCSPTASSSLAVTSGTGSRVGASPTIQALQGQVQTLKQAIKIKTSGNGDDDDALEQLVDKWTAVGRDVAWAVWDHVKDMDPGTSAPQQRGGWYADDEDDRAGSKRGFDQSWGYDDDEPLRKKARIEEEVEEEQPVVQHTIGVMLRRLGIDLDTLGWNEDEGDFVDM